jgi:hypothetical protein
MDIESIRDYAIADEIQRLSTLTRDALLRELIEARSVSIESMDDSTLLQKYGTN